MTRHGTRYAGVGPMTIQSLSDLERAIADLQEAARTLRQENTRRSSPPGARMETIVAKVPEEWIVLLDQMGPSRSEAIRRLLGKALASASGQRKKAAGQ